MMWDEEVSAVRSYSLGLMTDMHQLPYNPFSTARRQAAARVVRAQRAQQAPLPPPPPRGSQAYAEEEAAFGDEPSDIIICSWPAA